MATKSSAISPALPAIRNSLNNVQSQSWYRWTVAHLTVRTAIVSLVGVIVACILYNMIRTSKPAGKIKPIATPVTELKAQGFIRIYQECIAPSNAPIDYFIEEVRIRIEDSSGRRISTQYMKDIQTYVDIFSFLPLHEEVNIHLKVTRRNPVRTNPIKERMGPFRFRITHEVGSYPVGGEHADFGPLKEADYNYTTLLTVTDGQQKFVKRKIDLLEHGKAEANFADIANMPEDTIVFDNRSLDYRRILINMNANLRDVEQLKTPLYYVIGDGDGKRISLKWLIKDWKAAYKQETGRKVDYKGKENASNFYLASLKQSSYEKA